MGEEAPHWGTREVSVTLGNEEESVKQMGSPRAPVLLAGAWRCTDLRRTCTVVIVIMKTVDLHAAATDLLQLTCIRPHGRAEVARLVSSLAGLHLARPVSCAQLPSPTDPTANFLFSLPSPSGLFLLLVSSAWSHQLVTPNSAP